MNRSRKIFLVMLMLVIAMLAGGSSPGSEFTADINCEQSETLRAGITFVVVDEGGTVLYETSVQNAKSAACSISIDVRRDSFGRS